MASFWKKVEFSYLVIKDTWVFFWKRIKFNKNKSYVNKNNFQTLTPSSDVDLEIYEDAINYIFSENDIKNVAISGPYGAGKSSVIETYKKIHPEKKFIHLSLATFEDPNKTDIITKNGVEKNKEGNEEEISKIEYTSNLVLEGKIINQLIHQISANKIRRTLFKVKKDISLISVIVLGGASLLLLLFTMQYFFRKNGNTSFLD
nr:hypothetical protein [Providencia stuartii]